MILLSHFGRPKGRDPKQSLAPGGGRVARVIGRPVAFADDCIGADRRRRPSRAMKPGDILCLENTRFHAGEEKNEPAFVAALAKLGDIYVNDAFSAAHRAHASTEGLGASAARPMRAAPCRPSSRRSDKALEHPERPVAAIVGGAKVSTKLDLLGNLVAQASTCWSSAAAWPTPSWPRRARRSASRCASTTSSATAREILDQAAKAKREIVLPVDAVVAQKFEAACAVARRRRSTRSAPTT